MLSTGRTLTPEPPLARRPRNETEALRVKIREEAARIFAERGYGATSVQSVADAAGLSKQALLYHYNSKEALREAVYEGLVEFTNQRLIAIMTEVADAPDPVPLALGKIFALLDERPYYASLILRELLDSKEYASSRFLEGTRPWMDLFSQAIQFGQSQGMLRPDIDGEAAVKILGLLLLSLYATRTEHTRDEYPRFLKEYERLIRIGLFPDA